ncbi:YlmH/Sll1252 family protein [Clostridium uliginosum]|uniref:RNA-binding protein YlmH, contains S4-like domain n=1 Tax=Clostridium uliginosum TaxID=119641 RepID=A0A1I1NF22_9CLOT|nr:YlmH/Sll1252 family protein [Clostridium uliginosum]SFC96137.1 RNA-binding protein YlmH, contains S4-like domain [Clostridium uliginosum]
MKEQIVKYFGEEDRADALNLYEKYMLALDKDIPVFGKYFYTPNVWKWFQKKCTTNRFKVESKGLFENAERRMISFNNIYESPFPMKLVKIESKSKFSILQHRDFLGGILSLGIERNKIGDLLVVNNVCYLPVHEDIINFLLYNVDKIGKTPCSITEIEEGVEFPDIRLQEEIILISSLRIDGIVSKITKLSRAKAQLLIDQGQILIDYTKVKDKSYEVKEEERITIKGTGKFIIGNVIGNSKSGKYKMIIKKYT